MLICGHPINYRWSQILSPYVNCNTSASSHLLSEADPCVKTGADCSASGGKKVQPGKGGLYPLDTHPDLRHVAAKLLAQGQGGRVLGVGPTNLDDVVKLLRLGVQSIMKLPEMNTMS